jgi:hypothetical protein
MWKINKTISAINDILMLEVSLQDEEMILFVTKKIRRKNEKNDKH